MIWRQGLKGPVGAALFGMVLVLGGCGGGDGSGDDQETGPQVGQQSAPQADSQSGLQAALQSGGVVKPDTISAAADTTQPGRYYNSVEGQFRVIWPEGCGRIAAQTLTDPPGDSEGTVRTAHMFCDRKDKDQEGCAVVGYFDLRSAGGGPPTAEILHARVKQVMDTYRAGPLEVRPLRRGDRKGVRVRCRQAETGGEVWIEGYLVGENVYTLFAWKGAGEIFGDPQYERFFSSFAFYEGP